MSFKVIHRKYPRLGNGTIVKIDEGKAQISWDGHISTEKPEDIIIYQVITSLTLQTEEQL